jgi:hypothetical protein
VALLAALSGCAGCDNVPRDAVTDCSAKVVPGVAAADILFVIDDSGSTADKQQALADNLATFIDALLASPIALDLRIGVTNTSIDDYYPETTYPAQWQPSGVQPEPGYSGPPRTPFPAGTLVAIDPTVADTLQFGRFQWGTAYDDPAHLTSTWGGQRVLSSGPDLARYFKANVHQGEWGAGKEQPLRAMRLALDAAGLSSTASGMNVGLVRPGARQAVVILTDEDDCSESGTPRHVTSDPVCHGAAVDWQYFDPLDGFVTYLDSTVGALSGQPPVVAVIAGFDVTTGAATGCRGPPFDSYADPHRLGAFLDRLDAAHPDRTRRLSVCRPFGNALLSIAAAIIPQTMPLEQSPADWRMLTVAVERASGTVVGCRLAEAGSADEASADAVYAPPQAGGQGTITFKGGCLLGLGDRVQMNIICAR